jgi:two-component system alkaline phosphatase synthesis response regulator PhoP
MPKILVVDDEPDVVRLLEFRLQKDGFEVISATDGRMAVDVALAEKPDLLLLDVMMPVMDGVEALRQIRAHRGVSRIPVIMLTAKTDRITVDSARDQWVTDYITKPFDPEKLVLKVRKALKMPADA